MVGVAIFVLIVVAALTLFGTQKPSTTTQNNQTASTTTTFPVTGTGGTVSHPATGGSTTLTLQDGSTVSMSDVLHNGPVGKDPANKNLAYLAGSIGYCLGDGTCPAGVPSKSYVVTFDPAASFFNITITVEPLGETRKAVEQFLLDRTGLSEDTLCKSKYYLSVPADVNDTYAGPNLGFSFCPGATVLP